MLCKVSHKPGHVPLSPRQCSGLSKLPFRDTHTRSRTHTHRHRYTTTSTTIQGQALSTLGCRSREGEGKKDHKS